MKLILILMPPLRSPLGKRVLESLVASYVLQTDSIPRFAKPF